MMTTCSIPFGDGALILWRCGFLGGQKRKQYSKDVSTLVAKTILIYPLGFTRRVGKCCIKLPRV
ncbi:hypothetical protein FRX31_009225 [Thalictrum thalictroides]|uniref:Uncharacterized protein n=1 Tax=Thalictrum thalictroides TaxID=46969 RepID=A0A7J6WXB1_THATH|nr:hypothetical protein FRX31_009225 [Thalictrum thalictroides]